MNQFNYDDPDLRPRTSGIAIGESVSGTLQAISKELNKWGEYTIKWTVNGQDRWANKQLKAALLESRPQPGDFITVTRGPDVPSTGQHPRSTWTVTRHSGPAPIAAAAAPVAVAVPAAVPAVPAAPTQPALPDW